MPPNLDVKLYPYESPQRRSSERETPSTKQSRQSNIRKLQADHHENGRRYVNGEYWVPNDERQNNQLDIAHHLYRLTLNGRLYIAPIGESPRMVLDIGTGTGIWAMDFADQHPSAQVIGFDLSPVFQERVVPNVRFEVKDACDPDWGYEKNSFDFIHARGMYGCGADWPAFYQRVLTYLAPGGWYQQIEMSVTPTSDDGSVTAGSIFDQWGKNFLEAGDRCGKDFRVHKQVKGYLEGAGFEDVVELIYKWPIGSWSEYPRIKEIGRWNLVQWREGIEGWSLALLTRALNWSYPDIQAYLEKMREGFEDPTIRAYHIINVVYGRKSTVRDKGLQG